MSVEPAHPTVRTPSSSLSRLIRVEPVSSDPSSAFAPSSPTSSATVISSSSGPWGSDASSASAIIAAIATPSSAPRVVPSAFSQSPSRTSAIRPSAGSFGLAGSRSHTMSRCPWSDHGRRRLAAGRRRHADDEVAAGVLSELEAVPVGPCAHVLDHRLLGTRRPRDRRQRLEVRPERGGLDSGERLRPDRCLTTHACLRQSIRHHPPTTLVRLPSARPGERRPRPLRAVSGTVRTMRLRLARPSRLRGSRSRRRAVIAQPSPSRSEPLDEQPVPQPAIAHGERLAAELRPAPSGRCRRRRG